MIRNTHSCNGYFSKLLGLVAMMRSTDLPGASVLSQLCFQIRILILCKLVSLSGIRNLTTLRSLQIFAYGMYSTSGFEGLISKDLISHRLRKVGICKESSSIIKGLLQTRFYCSNYRKIRNLMLIIILNTHPQQPPHI